MKQFVIDANKCVLNKPSPEAKVEDGEFEENEVYAVDIAVSTGDGKTRVRPECVHPTVCGDLQHCSVRTGAETSRARRLTPAGHVRDSCRCCYRALGSGT